MPDIAFTSQDFAISGKNYTITDQNVAAQVQAQLLVAESITNLIRVLERGIQ